LPTASSQSFCLARGAERCSRFVADSMEKVENHGIHGYNGKAQTAKSAGFPANLRNAVSFLHPGGRGFETLSAQSLTSSARNARGNLGISPGTPRATHAFGRRA